AQRRQGRDAREQLDGRRRHLGGVGLVRGEVVPGERVRDEDAHAPTDEVLLLGQRLDEGGELVGRGGGRLRVEQHRRRRDLTAERGPGRGRERGRRVGDRRVRQEAGHHVVDVPGDVAATREQGEGHRDSRHTSREPHPYLRCPTSFT